MQTWMSQVRKGVIEFWVMAALGSGEKYGYELFQQLPGQAKSAAIYSILARLTREGQVSVRKGSSPAGPPRRYYRLTPKGTAQLKRMTAYWMELQRQTEAILRRA